MACKKVLAEIVVGTYEKFILGYNLELHSDAFKLKPSFSTEAHLQSVKCVASSDKFLASGSTDETIQLFNMKTRQELGTLLHHNGTVTSLEFYDSYLISSSEDKTICIWSTNNWQCIKTLSGHKNAVNCVSIHPSGKMAHSVSADKTLRTWNLIKGRSAYVTNIKKVADSVRWSPDGSCFLVSCGRDVDVYCVENASVVFTIGLQTKICDLTFINDNICAIGCENEQVYFYNVKSGSPCGQFKAHTSRVKGVKSLSLNDEIFLITASSDGYIKVWHVEMNECELKTRQVAKKNTSSRPTCLTVMLQE